MRQYAIEGCGEKYIVRDVCFSVTEKHQLSQSSDFTTGLHNDAANDAISTTVTTSCAFRLASYQFLG